MKLFYYTLSLAVSVAWGFYLVSTLGWGALFASICVGIFSNVFFKLGERDPG